MASKWIQKVSTSACLDYEARTFCSEHPRSSYLGVMAPTECLKNPIEEFLPIGFSFEKSDPKVGWMLTKITKDLQRDYHTVHRPVSWHLEKLTLFGDFLEFRGCVCRAHRRHRGSCAMPLAWVGYEIRLKTKN